MKPLRHPACALAFLGAVALCTSGAASGQDARERMTRMADGLPAAVAGPAAGEAVAIDAPIEGPPESRPLTPRTTPSRDAEPLPSAGSRGGGASGGSGGGYVLPTLAALGVVLGILYGLKAIAAKLGGFSPARPTAAVEVLSRTAVGPKGHILLLRVGARVLVVGDSAAGGLRTLADVHREEEVAELLRATSAASEAAGPDFSSLLSTFGKKPAPPEPEPDPLAGVQSRLQRMGGEA